MAKKGIIGAIASWLRLHLGGGSVVFRVIKAVGYFLVRLWGLINRITPRNLAYDLFPPQTPDFPGYVTVVDRNGISGVAFRTIEAEPAMVDLLLDGVRINRTWASQKATFPNRYRGCEDGFHFPMKRVWSQVPRTEKLEVIVGSSPLRYGAGPGLGPVLPNLGPKVIKGKSIIELSAAGFLITKFGRIQEPVNGTGPWVDKTFGGYVELNSIFEKVTGNSMFAFYGVMLGYAREGGVLAHDMDLDLAYFSEQSSPEKVKSEFLGIARKLVEAGLDFVPHSYKLQFRRYNLSLTPCWISDGKFSCTFGYVGGDFAVSRSDILPLRTVEHGKYQLLIPNNPQVVAAYLYGRGWKYPDPGWKWLPEYKNRPNILAARLSDADLKELEALATAIKTQGG
ncbi:MAG: hypothetical protein ABIJ86_13525 [Spirochaetota bacterium]